jgi:hypothetical protein
MRSATFFYNQHRQRFQLLLFVFACSTVASLQVNATAAVNGMANSYQQTSRKEQQEEHQGVVQSQSRYFSEILMGRCYAHPPTGNPHDDSKCPSLMGSVTGVVLGSNLDQDVTVTSFEPYFDSGADFTSPRDSAVLMMLEDNPALLPQQQQRNADIVPTLFVTPETTHGGAILANLVFCAVDVHDKGIRDDCRWSQTRLSFWQGAYSRFASHVHGHLRIFLASPQQDETSGSGSSTSTSSTANASATTTPDVWFKTLVLDAGIAHLDATALSGISIYSPSTPCIESKLVAQVKDALTAIGVPSNMVTCSQNIVSMVLTTNTCAQQGGVANEENEAICKCLLDATTAASSSSSTTKTATSSATSQEHEKAVVEDDAPRPGRNRYTLFFFLAVVPFAGGYILMAHRLKRAAATYDRVRDVSC